ncbi:hypothetical protein ACWDSJ_37570, partial [Nocardia sp. NPDC003482]
MGEEKSGGRRIDDLSAPQAEANSRAPRVHQAADREGQQRSISARIVKRYERENPPELHVRRGDYVAKAGIEPATFRFSGG